MTAVAARAALARSPLATPAALPLRPPETMADFGPTLVVAPHPDDESLGCGGAIATLRRLGLPVWVLFISDGTLSHPRSRAYPPERLRATRESEARAALALLGVAPEAAIFLRLRDRAVPAAGAPGFDAAVGRVRATLTADPPATILLPWRRDPHPDHRAAWQIVGAAFAGVTPGPRLIEYLIWIWELAEPADVPAPGEMLAWRLDIAAVLPAKGAAIAAHRSQTTDLITDDPEGFRLSPEILAHFADPWEIYLEAARDG